jgi:hypothetical protein
MDKKIETWGKEFCRRHGITWELVTPSVIEAMYRDFEKQGLIKQESK